MTLRMLRAAMGMVLLALLPGLGTGCATDRARAGDYPPVSAVGGSTPAATQSALVPPPSMPALREELWVIEKRSSVEAANDGKTPKGGSLVVQRGGRFVPVPLEHTDVKATIAAHVATVDVSQRFHNPFNTKIEAVYVFPLPHNAAISEFVMTVGQRRIRGIIRERDDAKQVYEAARRLGYVVSLVEQDRPNVFSQRVANIEPGKQIDVSVRYFHTLDCRGGWYEWIFPMVVGPRFNPPVKGDEPSTASRDDLYRRPKERSGRDVGVSVKLDASVTIDAVESRTHAVTIARKSPTQCAVTVDELDSLPNKDFVLRWKVAGDSVRSGLIAQPGEDGDGYFAMTIVPPAGLSRLPRLPMEMVFALDVSRSMDGRPIEQAKAAVRWALARLRPDDTFQLVRFAARAELMADRPLPATPSNVRRAMQYLEKTSAGGGTMLLDGLRKVFSPPADVSRPRYAIFLTDGYIGNEAQVLGALQQTLGDSRVFSVGVGPSPNRYLLEQMAKLGRGAVACLGLADRPHETMAEYLGAISHPALTNLAIDWGGTDAFEVYPRRLPDVLVGRPVTVVGRFRGKWPERVWVTGNLGGESREIVVATNRAAPEEAALPAVWARMKIADLGDRLAAVPNDGEAAMSVRRVALEHGLMSAYTAFVAVDSMTRTAGDVATTLTAPVPTPEGVGYETTVAE